MEATAFKDVALPDANVKCVVLMDFLFIFSLSWAGCGTFPKRMVARGSGSLFSRLFVYKSLALAIVFRANVANNFLKKQYNTLF